jgi:plasmid stabilization system protein ParE
VKVIFHKIADDEYWQQIDYYQKIDDLLAERLINSIDLVIDGIASNPYLCHNRGDGIYSVRVRGFPISIFYKVHESYIFVVSVCHQRRDPKVWKFRK